MRGYRVLLAGLAALVMAIPLVVHSGYAGLVIGGVGPMPGTEPALGRSADFATVMPSADARYLADWIADSRDNQASDFIVVDKKSATVYVFDGLARLLGSSPALLGAAIGDHTVPGIGERPLKDVLPEERTTPAGRFVAERGHNTNGVDIVWVDYDAAVSIHRVVTSNPQERRLERLATPRVDDNRISWGCINVPVAFFESTIKPLFATRRALVYVLPETRSVQQVFGAYDVAARRRAGVASVP